MDSVTINVIARPLDTKVNEFELDMFKKIVDFHNKKNETRFKLNVIFEPDFNKIRPEMLSGKYDLDSICSIASFTISNIPKFEYSYPYLPVRDSFISLKNFEPSAAKLKSAYNDNPFNKAVIDAFEDKDKYEFIPYNGEAATYDALRNGEVDVCMGDSYIAFFEDDLKVYRYISKKSKFLGIIFPRGSALKNELNNTIKYFMKSSTYYAMLREYLGRDITRYVEKTMKGY